MGIYDYNSFLVRKKILKLWGAAFHVFGPNNEVLMYSELKAFKLKEDIRIYTDEGMQTELLRIKSRHVIDFAAVYDVYDSLTNEKIGSLRRNGFKSLIKDEWSFLNENDEVIGLIKEDSMVLALLRRLLLRFLPQEYAGFIGDNQVCGFKQNVNPFVTKILVSFNSNIEEIFDKRMGLAAAILLCAIEGKQD